ncbi:MAG: hypothetical protein ACJ73S_29000 [Mycobacteriales bacterium]
MSESNGARTGTRERNWTASVTTDQRWLVPDLTDLSEPALRAVLDRRMEADEPTGVVFTPEGYQEMYAKLAGVAEDTLDRGGMYCALFCVPYEGSALSAVATLLPAAGEDTDPETLVRTLAATHPGDAGRRRIDVVQVPAGPAVRIRCMVHLPLDKTDQQVVDSVQYWVPVEDTGDLAVLSFATGHLAFGDFFAEAFDEVAATLEVTVLD